MIDLSQIHQFEQSDQRGRGTANFAVATAELGKIGISLWKRPPARYFVNLDGDAYENARSAASLYDVIELGIKMAKASAKQHRNRRA